MLSELATTIMLGSGRLQSLPAHEGALGEALAKTSRLPTEQQVLAAASLLATSERAGMLPQVVAEEEVLPPCPADASPTCSVLAADVLRQILGTRPALLPEWLELAAAAGQVAPPSCLEELLEWGRRETASQAAIRTVCGMTGSWLGRLNPRWEYAIASPSDDDKQLWEEGRQPEREGLLRRLRQEDPGRARELIVEAFAVEHADCRTAFIATLETGLAAADEAFLDRALDDRSTRVTAIAASLLSRLPDSALSQRMAERLRSHLKVERKFIKGRRLVVEPPDEPFDAEALRDGLQEQGKGSGKLGKVAHRLVELVRLTPLGVWDAFDLGGPASVLMAIEGTDWRDALVQGLAVRAVAEADADWCLALLAIAPGKAVIDRRALRRALPREQREAQLASDLAEGRGKAARELLLEVLESQEEPAGPRLSRQLVASAQQAISQHKDDWQLRNVLPILGLLIAPECLSQALAGWPADHTHWTYYASQYAEFDLTIRLRTRIYEGFQHE